MSNDGMTSATGFRNRPGFGRAAPARSRAGIDDRRTVWRRRYIRRYKRRCRQYRRHRSPRPEGHRLRSTAALSCQRPGHSRPDSRAENAAARNSGSCLPARAGSGIRNCSADCSSGSWRPTDNSPSGAMRALGVPISPRLPNRLVGSHRSCALGGGQQQGSEGDGALASAAWRTRPRRSAGRRLRCRVTAPVPSPVRPSICPSVGFLAFHLSNCKENLFPSPLWQALC